MDQSWLPGEIRSGEKMSNLSPQLIERFSSLAGQYISDFDPARAKKLYCCIFHPDRTPSLSINVEAGVFHCFGCGQSGGVKDFARLVGEPWNSARGESRAARARRARFHAEQQARAILERRAEARSRTLCAEHREVFAEIVAAADLLALFYRRPDLAAEFPVLATRTGKEYGEALFKQSLLEAQLEREVSI